MTHDSASQTVVSLVPEIEKRGAAEVLTEFARREDLPPSQLEKLGQVYNTLRTISHIDNAKDDRGSSVPLLDVPIMVAGYATGADREKVATGPLSISSHDLNTVDLNRALNLELRQLSSPPSMAKAASTEVTTTPEKAAESVLSFAGTQEFEAALLDVEIDLENEMAKLAGEIIGAAPLTGDSTFRRDVSFFEVEALRRQPEEAVKQAGDYLERYAEPLHITLDRFGYDREIEKYAYEIPHAMGEKFAALAEAATSYDVIVKLAAETIPKSPDEGTKDKIGYFGAAPPTDPPAFDDIPDTKKETDTGGGETAEEAAAKANQHGVTPVTGKPSKDDQDKDKDKTKAKDKDNGGGGGGRNRDGDKKSEPKEKSLDPVGAATDLLARPLNAVSSGVQGAAAKADDILTKITTKERQNKAQKDLDIDIEDIKRTMNVSRMIANDPVLREVEPKEVMEVYNSIAARNPDIAGDMAALRLVLREAVSYEGLTLDAQKMLSDIRKNEAQGSQVAQDNDRKRYSVGGAMPIQISKA